MSSLSPLKDPFDLVTVGSSICAYKSRLGAVETAWWVHGMSVRLEFRSLVLIWTTAMELADSDNPNAVRQTGRPHGLTYYRRL